MSRADAVLPEAAGIWVQALQCDCTTIGREVVGSVSAVVFLTSFGFSCLDF